ncbi:S-4TM family putative pore-forming effector [Enterococcus avium]|uniref:S-4TM family putative pore-forming effector n=1 Tax=Enterococcus avium TaxID=33945 RepID=UPI00288FD894|nr:S-4TM family putative pore-forming effector [Enterococcus avium]MDT2502553.1 S-4TM family putative pore-forming effector [Enterococcus avium]
MDLLERQNKRQSLEIQATARLLYNRSQTIDMIQWIIVLLLPILKIFLIQNLILDYVMIIWFFLSFVFDYFIDKYADLGSELKKGFDYYVYGWSDQVPGNLVRLSNESKARNKSFFAQQISNSGTDNPGGVKDWYTSVKKDMSKEESIKTAMNENIYFDKRINKSAFILILFILATIVIAFAVSGLSFYEVLFDCFVTFATFTKKLYSTFLNLKKVSNINENMEKLLDSKDVDLHFLQSEIDKKRSISRTSNKLVYFFQTKKVHKEVSNFNS